MADPVTWVYIASAVVSAGTAVYSARQRSKDAKAAAEYNSLQAKNAAKTAANDSKENAIRRQEAYRKHLGSLRAKMLANAGSIEGGNEDFLNETTSDLQLRILDDAAKSNRQQAAYQNAVFRADFQGEQAARAGKINTASAAVSGFASVYSAGKTSGAWGYSNQQKASSALTQSSSAI